MQNNNNIQLPLIFQKNLSWFFVAFASIRFIWFKLPWRYLLFIVIYSYAKIKVTKDELVPKGQKLRPKAENNG